MDSWRQWWRGIPRPRSCGCALRGWRVSACTTPVPPFTGGISSRPWPPSSRRDAAPRRPGETATADSIVPSWVDEPAVDRASVSGVIITIDHFGNLISNIDAAADRAFPAAAGACRQPCFPAAANLWRHAAGGVPGAGQFLRGDRDRPRRAERGGRSGTEPGRPRHRCVTGSSNPGARPTSCFRAGTPSWIDCSGARIRYSSLPCSVHTDALVIDLTQDLHP